MEHGSYCRITSGKFGADIVKEGWEKRFDNMIDDTKYPLFFFSSLFLGSTIMPFT